ncbi:MAG: helix-turn-helix domain-containing protein [Spirochaetaceae bacterium]|jgi:two-component system response regulator YesN|nr:helix-turn-helix domain-containing protein [Spirochaetaceae bacterium]
MYRVLLVEDEEPVLDSYEFMLKSTEDFSSAGKARTGYEAIRMIYELEPDLVFMDINIPGVDGLAVIAEVHDKFPAMDFVISTAYERFDLALKAIPLGVFAYLVKPVTKKTFFETLAKFRGHYAARLRNAAILSAAGNGAAVPGDGADEYISGHGGYAPAHSGVGARSMPPAERQFLRKIIREAVTEEAWEAYRRNFNLPSDRGLICVLETGYEDAEIGGAAIAEKLSFRYFCIHDTLLSRDIFFISGDSGRDAFEKQFVKILGETAPAQALRHYGIGGLFRGPELYRSAAEAQSRLEEKQSRTGVMLRRRRLLVQLRQKIGIAVPEEVKKLFTRLWGEVFAGDDFTAAKAKMIPVFMFLIDDCTGFYRGRSEELPPFDAAEEIMGLGTMAEWEAWASAAFDTLQRRISLRRSANLPLPLIRAVEYVHEHYAEGIQLGSAASAAQVSPAYLSRLFTEHLKTTFIDYLTELRIENAGRLLRESRLNIKEISRAVGYQDPNYFSRLFRKITGSAPHELRGEPSGGA